MPLAPAGDHSIQQNQSHPRQKFAGENCGHVDHPDLRLLPDLTGKVEKKF